jgi:hypothetical protein
MNLVRIHGNYYRMEESKEIFESVCDVKGHLFLDEYSEYDADDNFDGNLYAKCFVCENLIKFWYYSPEMVDVMKSKELCC